MKLLKTILSYFLVGSSLFMGWGQEYGDMKYHGSIVGHGDFQYKVDLKWSKANPKTHPVKNCNEMVQVSDGRLFLLTDHKKNNILIFNTEGELLDSWTLGINAHGLTTHIEKSGKEVLWITDLRGRVIKTDLEGQVLMELKSPHELKVYSPHLKYTPTETAIAPDGSIFVADGYGSQYILKYDKEGTFIKKFGGKSTQPTNKGKFMQAHGVAIDGRDPENPLVLCSARIRNEFTWFDLDGKYVKSVYLPGAYISRPVIHGENIYSGICFGMFENDYRMWQGRGFVTILDKNNKVISNPGGRAPVYKNGQLQLMLQDLPIIKNAHDVCVDKDGNIYVCQWASNQAFPYKFVKITK